LDRFQSIKGRPSTSFTSAKLLGEESTHKDGTHLWFTSFMLFLLAMVSFIPDPPEPWFGLALGVWYAKAERLCQQMVVEMLEKSGEEHEVLFLY
jgi:hypothetical protein